MRPFLTDERTHRKTGFDEFVRESRADEPSCTGDEKLALSVHPSRVPICRGFESCRPHQRTGIERSKFIPQATSAFDHATS